MAGFRITDSEYSGLSVLARQEGRDAWFHDVHGKRAPVLATNPLLAIYIQRPTGSSRDPQEIASRTNGYVVDGGDVFVGDLDSYGGYNPLGEMLRKLNSPGLFGTSFQNLLETQMRLAHEKLPAPAGLSGRGGKRAACEP